MKFIIILSSVFILTACPSSKEKIQSYIAQPSTRKDSLETKSCEELKKEIEKSRKQLSLQFSQSSTPGKNELIEEIKKSWVNTFSNDLYQQWKNTPWILME